MFALGAIAMPLLFLPLAAFQLAGFPEYSEPASFFIRIAGAMVLTVASFQLWACLDASHQRGSVLATVVECVATLMVLWHYVFYGDMATWPIRGKLIVGAFGLAQLLFLVAVIVTGWQAVFSRQERGAG